MLRAQYIPVSRLHLSRYVISSSKNAPRAARAEKCRRASLAPRRAGTSHGTHSTNAQLKSIAFAITLVAHAVRQGPRPSSVEGEARARNSAFIMCAGKRRKALGVHAGRARGKKPPTPCTNEAFTSRARQGGFLETKERRERERVMSRHIDTA